MPLERFHRTFVLGLNFPAVDEGLGDDDTWSPRQLLRRRWRRNLLRPSRCSRHVAMNFHELTAGFGGGWGGWRGREPQNAAFSGVCPVGRLFPFGGFDGAQFSLCARREQRVAATPEEIPAVVPPSFQDCQIILRACRKTHPSKYPHNNQTEPNRTEPNNKTQNTEHETQKKRDTQKAQHHTTPRHNTTQHNTTQHNTQHTTEATFACYKYLSFRAHMAGGASELQSRSSERPRHTEPVTIPSSCWHCSVPGVPPLQANISRSCFYQGSCWRP